MTRKTLLPFLFSRSLLLLLPLLVLLLSWFKAELAEASVISSEVMNCTVTTEERTETREVVFSGMRHVCYPITQEVREIIEASNV